MSTRNKRPSYFISEPPKVIKKKSLNSAASTKTSTASLKVKSTKNKKSLNSARGKSTPIIMIDKADQNAMNTLEQINRHLENLMKPLD